MRETEHKQKEEWRKFFLEWKKVIRNPSLSVYAKVILFNTLLYRSDNEGWYISERKFAKDLGISKGTASNAIDEAIKNGWLSTNKAKERKRRKLRLSGFLQAPVRVSEKPNIWVSSKPTKYQREYQNNSSFENERRTGQMEKALTKEDTSRFMEKMRSQYKFLKRKQNGNG